MAWNLYGIYCLTFLSSPSKVEVPGSSWEVLELFQQLIAFVIKRFIPGEWFRSRPNNTNIGIYQPASLSLESWGLLWVPQCQYLLLQMSMDLQVLSLNSASLSLAALSALSFNLGAKTSWQCLTSCGSPNMPENLHGIPTTIFPFLHWAHPFLPVFQLTMIPRGKQALYWFRCLEIGNIFSMEAFKNL